MINTTLSAIKDPGEEGSSLQPFRNLTAHQSVTLATVLLSLHCFQSLLIFATNSITIMAIVRIPVLWSNTTRFIACLSMADLVACLIPFGSVMRYNWEPESNQWSGICFVEKFLLMVCLLGNMIFALCVSIDRYIFMGYPLRYQVIATSSRVRVIIAGAWAFIIIQTILVDVLTHLDDTRECYLNGLLMWGSFYIIVVLEFCLFLILTLKFILSYALMLWKQSRQTGAWMGSVAVAGGDNKDISDMIGGVVTIHAICFIPSFLVGGMYRTVTVATLYKWEFVTSTFLLINSWVKPFIYYAKNRDFKTGYEENFKDIAKGRFQPRPAPALAISAPPP